MVEVDNAGEPAPGQVEKADGLRGESVTVEDQADMSGQEDRQGKS